jgi:beta-glucanase (GH16 family)
MNMTTLRFFIAGMFLLIRVHAGSTNGAPDRLPALPPGQEWKLTWSDEFDGAIVDTNKWDVMGDWKRRDGWWVKEDSFLDGKGNLVLRTKKDGERFTSGAVRTRGRFEHAFGFWTTRCQLPKEQGHWSAFWLMSQPVFRVGDAGRDGTEIDVAEFPWRDGRYEINLHWDGYGKEHKSAGKNITAFPAITNGFHNFSLLWTTNEYVFYVDGNEVWRTKAGGVSQNPEYAKFSNEVGVWAGDIKKAKLPDDFIIDYIRVYDAVPTMDKSAAKQ